MFTKIFWLCITVVSVTVVIISKCFLIKGRVFDRHQTACKTTFDWIQYISSKLPKCHHCLFDVPLTVPVTVAKAKKLFSKLKFSIKHCDPTTTKQFGSFMYWERHNAKYLLQYFDVSIDISANIKSRKKSFLQITSYIVE